ncbi:TPA: DUF3265 domain-containing protein [Vibrio vulnificus]
MKHLTVWNLRLNKHNKALKRDSCRVAFLVCSDLCGEIGLRKAGLGGSHPLTQRYAFGDKLEVL